MNVVFTILVVLIIIAAILLIAVVLLQNGKDGGLATNFTSANQALGVRQTATLRGNTGSAAGDAVSTEILNNSAAAEGAPDFQPVEQADPTAAQENPAE